MKNSLLKILFTLVVFLFSATTLFASNINSEGDSVKGQTDDFIDSILNVFSKEYGTRILFAILAVVLTIVFAKIIKDKLFGYLENRLGGDVTGKDEILGVINRTVNVIILATGFSITLGVLGLDLSIFIGGIGFGIGFTLRVFLTNFVSGVLMVTQGIYHPGDLVELSGKKGTISKIYSLFTAIRQFDGVMFFVPNIKFLEENVQNFHTNEKRRLEIEMKIDYSIDTVKAKSVLIKVMESFPNVLQAPAPDIVIESLGEWGLFVKLRFWIISKDNYISIKSNITETINLAFRQSDIKIAAPKIPYMSPKLEK